MENKKWYNERFVESIVEDLWDWHASIVSPDAMSDDDLFKVLFALTEEYLDSIKEADFDEELKELQSNCKKKLNEIQKEWENKA